VTVISPLVYSLRNRRYFAAVATALMVCLLLYVGIASPVDRFDLQLGTISGKEWKAEGVRLKINWTDGRNGSFTFSAARVVHASLPFPLLSPGIHCSKGALDDYLVNCEQGRLEVATPALDNDSFPLKFVWNRVTQTLSFSLEEIGFAKGTIKLNFDGKADDWKLSAAGNSLSIGTLLKKLPAMGLTVPALQATGRTDIDLKLAGRGATRSANWRLKFRRAAFSDPEGSYIGEGLSGDWRGNLRNTRHGYYGSARLTLAKGALLTPFIYLEPEGDEIKVALNYDIDTELSNLRFDHFEYRHPKVFAFSAEGRINLAGSIGIRQLKVRSAPFNPGVLLNKYLLPTLTDEFFQSLNLDGMARLEFETAQTSKLKLNLEELTIRQGDIGNAGQGDDFRFSGVQGDLFWSSGDSVRRSNLSWQDGVLSPGIKIGSGRAFLKLRGNSVQLDEPFSLPVLDGALRAERFSINQTDTGSRVDFQGYITPISMKLISEALGWPPLAGQLSAMIPGVSYEDSKMELRGLTLIRAFDGTIVLKNLRLDDLLGPLPVLLADVELKALDLETLTATFSFGKITGRLEGWIKGLRLEQWKPVAFDARFATPEEDPGPHRISQKAVDNISNLGGVGISGALSRSFLRFFEEFGYAKLGISCRLEKSVCEMGGIESSSKGYYLVKGGGLPRIDIIGFNHKTDWDVLVDKLKQIAEGDSPVIQ